MSDQLTRHMFPGGNTANGFVGFFPHILSIRDANRIYVTKGGPGVGKSTLMKRIGQAAQDRGYAVEYFHCSSDPDSLDAIHIPALRVAMLDGTAPHVVDPQMPGAVDGITNLGEFLMDDRMQAYKEAIGEIQDNVSRSFGRAFRFLSAARQIREDAAASYAVDEGARHKLLGKWMDRIFEAVPMGDHVGRERDLYLSAITPKGLVHFLDEFSARHRWRVRAPWGTDLSEGLKLLSRMACMRGLNVECYHCALDADRIEHLYISGLDLLISTENEYHAATVSAERTIDLTEGFVTPLDAKRIDIDQQLFDILVEQAVESLARAKALHDDLEAYYIDHMNYAGVQEKFDELVAQIFPEH